MGESHDSGRNLGWDGNGKMATFPNEFRESSCKVSRIEIGADNGLFATRNVLSTTLASRGRVAKTPLLAREFAVWQGFWARQAIQGPIQAWTAGQRVGKSSPVPERIMGEILAMSQNRDQG